MDSKKIRRIISKAMLSAFASLIICIAVWLLIGDIPYWKKRAVCVSTFSILYTFLFYSLNRKEQNLKQ